MKPNFIKRLFASRRSATAVAFAIMFVPMVISASAAVDFARIASARAMMQSAVDGATETGANAYQMSENFAEAGNATTTTLSATSATLGRFVGNIQTNTGVYCNSGEATAQQCGSNYAVQGNLLGNCPAAFATTEEYCVVATMSATLKNSLFAYLLPSEVLTVSSVGTTLFPPSNVSGKNIPPSPGFGSASDLSGIYAYAVPMSGNTPQYGTLPQPNSDCGSEKGPIQYENLVAPQGTSSCNYLFVSDSKGDSGSGGSITLTSGQPIAFSFVNDVGETTSYGLSTSYLYTTALTVNGSYYPNGYTATSTTCQFYYYGYCYGQQHSSFQLFGQCPEYNLYGAFSQGIGGTENFNDNNGNTITVTQSAGDNGALNTQNAQLQSDSLNVFSSAYEVLGYPPTHATNHILPQFSNTVTE
ncbi:MAG: hypothetical protein B7Z81_13055, partial [Acidocella sp. 20-61-6]